MRKILTIALLLSFISCEEKQEMKENTIITKSGPSPSKEVVSQTDAIENQEELDPTIIDSTRWKNYISVKIGDADYKGRYSYQYEVYTIQNGKKKKIANAALFNNKLDELEKIINDKIKTEYDLASTDKESEECFQGVECKIYSIDEMGIEFDKKNNILFNGGFGLAGACFSVDYFSIKMPLDSIDNYIIQ